MRGCNGRRTDGRSPARLSCPRRCIANPIRRSPLPPDCWRPGTVRTRRAGCRSGSSRSPSVAAKACVRLGQLLTRAVNVDRLARTRAASSAAAWRAIPERCTTMAELYELAAAVPDCYRALVLIAGLAGLREGELFALRWGDVDLIHGVITVRRKRVRLASGEVLEDGPEEPGGEAEVGAPGHARRRARAPPERPREEGRARCLRLRLARRPAAGAQQRPPARVDSCHPLAGLPGLRFHDLRHTAGTPGRPSAPPPRSSWPASATPAPGRQ